MLVRHRQQSAIISHSRTDIGARHSGQAHINASPSSQNIPEDVRPASGSGGAIAAIAGQASSGSWGSGPSDDRSTTVGEWTEASPDAGSLPLSGRGKRRKSRLESEVIWVDMACPIADVRSNV
jgi:hypothetical protein